MINPEHVPAVDADEKLARYILHSKHIRRHEQTLRPDAFIPHPYEDLSVTRHRSAADQELWNIGDGIANTIGTKIYGRGDFKAAVCIQQNLTVTADPVQNNPNHANVSNWPPTKPEQKIIAIEMAASAAFVSRNK